MGDEFQIVGAAKVNERRPFAERMSGTDYDIGFKHFWSPKLIGIPGAT